MRDIKVKVIEIDGKCYLEAKTKIEGHTYGYVMGLPMEQTSLNSLMIKINYVERAFDLAEKNLDKIPFVEDKEDNIPSEG